MEKKKPWDPESEDCARAFYEIAKRENVHDRIAAELNKQFEPTRLRSLRITAAMVRHAVKSGKLTRKLRELYPEEANEILARVTEDKRRTRFRPHKTGKALPLLPGGRVMRFTPRLKNKPVPIRTPDPEAARESAAIDAYLTELKARGK